VTDSDRWRGCLLGLAVGDALGTTLEFTDPGTFQPIDDIVGGGPFGLLAGEWTDDTSMALCLAESLVESNGFDGVDQLRRYIRWYRDGHLSSNGRCFDIGGTVRRALHRFERTGEAECGSSAADSAGNGSLMRLAPAPMFFASDYEAAIEMSGQSSRTTHASQACVDACRYFGGLIAGAVRGRTKDDLLSERFHPEHGAWAEGALHPAIDEVAAGSFGEKEPPDIQGSGHVVRAMEAALWAFVRSENFGEGCLLAVNLGDDADTTGAIYGQLAGAFYGASGIPAGWLDRLAHRELIVGYADRLHEAARAG
jgi:ADP-ribosyl-[dinitrogen reductase] hydrolase